MAQNFFDLLYNGYTGEYQLMSSLYRNGLDALRPPADMGIDGERLAALRDGGAFFRVEGETKLTLACQLRKPTHEWGHWYAVVVGEKGQQIPEGYLGVVGGSGNPASDGANHYSVRGYLDHDRA